MDKPSLPARVGKYELEEFLGGGMSHVYRARDTLIGGTVALKILSEAANRDPDARARFLREARMARNVSHENIVAIYDFGEEQGRPYMVMEFLRGETLRSAIERGRTGDLASRLRIAIQIARAMECIHAQGIIHRDIKPDNINLGPDGKVKLMDFGIAKTEDMTITRAGFTLGTPHYMAPEQVMGQKLTPQVDVYAFGILLFELMTGVKPIKADTVERIFYEILRKPLDLTPMRMLGLPAALCELVTRCTAKSPAERPQNFAAVREELERILERVEHPSPASALAGVVARLRWALASVSSKLRAGTRKGVAAVSSIPRRSWKIAGAAVLLAIALAAGIALWPTRQQATPKPKTLAPVLQTSTGEMVLVPAGEFLFGPEKRPVKLPAFYIDRTEVTYGAYIQFCRARGLPPPPGYSEARLNYPVAEITIAEARQFAAWANKRLPTPEEWEKAARGTDGRVYPWGDQADPERANVSDNSALMVHAAMPALSFRGGASPFGVLNMVGNVAEYVEQRVTPTPEAIARFAKLLEPPPGPGEEWSAVRGGSWTTKLADAAVTAFFAAPARWRDPTVGFRCVRAAE
ncbi:MAG: bifunctional serine/threonine-protein kinase/formylglycine-generating enzyme family protein [Bryobacterales bacterium]|nr:bifunctional serine/threonine-protein kinase/formylglycine-generating enzyme family protein [Bryobacteraceae bacterium]MDW8129359.1 bifunctional serine/threonine-protein kinase/formylglycine-generating enzyme family protein [Bryobacterales bacterium]